MDKIIAIGSMASVVAVFVVPAVAWITHLVWIISTLASDGGANGGQMLLGILGTFVPPIGMIHGILIWLGFSL
ncbi:hypothetical protein [Hoeflea sp.]|uniref:hypothetical protein n=1 Tax=Hoeflea sp. TaxID=1940281 RepID=UPI003B530585